MRVLGRNMELMALKRGQSLQDISDKTGVSVYHLRKLRNATQSYIDPEVLRALMEFFEVTPNDLLCKMQDVTYD